MCRTIRLLTVTSLRLIALCGSVAAQDYKFEVIHFPGSADTLVLDINDLGWVVGQYGDIDLGFNGNPDTHAFLYDGESYQTISYPNALMTKALGVNNSGDVVGEFASADGVNRGFHFDGESYREITTPTGAPVAAADINDAGVIVGTVVVSELANDIRGFRLDNDSYAEIVVPAAQNTIVQSISSDETIVGTFIAGPLARGFVAPGFKPISFSSFGVSAANGISSNNLVAGTFLELLPPLNAHATGFLYDIQNDQYTEVPFPGTPCDNFIPNPNQCNKALHAVNAKGELAGFFDDNDGVFRGFIGRPVPSSDLDRNGIVDAYDIDELTFAILSGNGDSIFDLNLDGVVSVEDHRYLVNELIETFLGDANLDGQFDSADLVAVFAAGQYEDGVFENSTWETGDWNADFEFGTSDLIAAFQDGGYDKGPRNVVHIVPEPDAALYLLLLISAYQCRRERHIAE